MSRDRGQPQPPQAGERPQLRHRRVADERQPRPHVVEPLERGAADLLHRHRQRIRAQRLRFRVGFHLDRLAHHVQSARLRAVELHRDAGRLEFVQQLVQLPGTGQVDLGLAGVDVHLAHTLKRQLLLRLLDRPDAGRAPGATQRQLEPLARQPAVEEGRAQCAPCQVSSRYRRRRITMYSIPAATASPSHRSRSVSTSSRSPWGENR